LKLSKPDLENGAYATYPACNGWGCKEKVTRGAAADDNNNATQDNNNLS